MVEVASCGARVHVIPVLRVDAKRTTAEYAGGLRTN